MPKTSHQRIHGRASARLRRILFQPLAEGSVQRLALCPCHQPRLLDEAFIRAESNIFHARIVYTISVCEVVDAESIPCQNLLTSGIMMVWLDLAGLFRNKDTHLC